MRLYVRCPYDQAVVYLNLVAQSHDQLPLTIEVLERGHVHHLQRNTVRAEAAGGAGAGGAVVGGLLGLLGGPIGLVVGALFGGALGAGAEQSDRAAADRFNAEVD